MNPLKKLKLKSQLRNCDYMLAGAVIRQQYYDAKKSTVINRLIDDFMANPGFDNALKLIEYNDMMVFYFTESCAGGLYVRKTIGTDLGKSESEPLPEAVESIDILHEQQKQILEESEAWMEQMIASGARKHPHTPPASPKIEIAEAEPVPIEEAIPTAQEEPVVEEMPAIEPLPPRPTIRKRSYANVIATLKIDIHTMSQQLDEYRRELSYYPSNEKQLISWIKALEDAIEEFSDVVDLLEDGI